MSDNDNDNDNVLDESKEDEQAGASSARYSRTLAVVLRSVTKEEDRYSVLSGVGSLLMFVGLLALRSSTILAGLVVFIGVIAMAVGASPRQRTEITTRRARVRVSPSAINVEGVAEPIQAKSIAQAYFQPRKESRETVRCVAKNGSVLFEAEVDSEAEAVRFLRALGRDPAQRRADFPVASWADSTPLRRLVTVLGGLGVFASVMWLLSAIGVTGFVWLVALATLAGLVAVMSRGRVEIGTDGLLLARLGRPRHFVSYDRIRRVVEAGGSGLRLVLNDGKKDVFLQAIGGELGRDALHARIEEARKAYGERTGTRDLAARVARGARALAEWRADLAKLILGDAGYREAATRLEDLWRLVEDPGAPEDARAAAALVLRKNDNDDATPRLRVAAQAVASPRLRIALETAADPDSEEQAIDEALASFGIDDDEEDEKKKKAAAS